MTARAPVALASLQQAFMSQKLNVDEMLGMLEVTCESILSTDPTALSPNTNPSALALVNFEHSVCAACEGTDRSPRCTNNQRDERPDWSQYNGRNKIPPADVRKPLGGTGEWHWYDKHKHWGGHSTDIHHGGRGGDRDRG